MRVEIFFSRTHDLTQRVPELIKFISADELSRAVKLHFAEDRETFISSHALLRIALSVRLNTSPSDVIIDKDHNNKPVLPGKSLFFNLTHSRDAFAFAIAENFHVGIDLENINRNLDLSSLFGTCLTSRERMFVEEIPDNPQRFFMLWTRKEAYLKALGTGITNNLGQINTFQQTDFMNRYYCEDIYEDHLIYSMKISEYYLSIAAPQRVEIIMNNINELS